MRKALRLILPLMFVLAIIVIFSIYKTRVAPDDNNGQSYFNATVLSVSNDEIKVECSDTLESTFQQGDIVVFSKDIISANGIPELNIDDEIRIVYNGDVVAEGMSIQLSTVFAIYKLEVGKN